MLDVTLVVQHIPPTTDLSIVRSQRLPPTNRSPGILLGLRSTTRCEEDGSVVTYQDVAAISELISSHHDTVEEYLDHQSHAVIRWARRPTWATLFCTYLKAGFLHILAILLRLLPW